MTAEIATAEKEEIQKELSDIIGDGEKKVIGDGKFDIDEAQDDKTLAANMFAAIMGTGAGLFGEEDIDDDDQEDMKGLDRYKTIEVESIEDVYHNIDQIDKMAQDQDILKGATKKELAELDSCKSEIEQLREQLAEANRKNKEEIGRMAAALEADDHKIKELELNNIKKDDKKKNEKADENPPKDKNRNGDLPDYIKTMNNRGHHVQIVTAYFKHDGGKIGIQLETRIGGVYTRTVQHKDCQITKYPEVVTGMCVYEMIIFQAYTYVGTRVKAKHGKDLIKHMAEGIEAKKNIEMKFIVPPDYAPEMVFDQYVMSNVSLMKYKKHLAQMKKNKDNDGTWW